MRTISKALTNPQIPANGGCFRALDVVCPDETVFTARRPAPVSTYWETMLYAEDLIWKALAELVPDRLTAGHVLSVCAIIIAGDHADTGDPTILVCPLVGGWGAMHNRDGLNGQFSVADGETYNIPVEITAACPDSGGTPPPVIGMRAAALVFERSLREWTRITSPTMKLGNGATIRSVYLARVSYEAGVELQHRLRRQLLDGEPDASDTLLLLEHPPTYTVGRNCDRGDVLAEPDWLRQRGIAVAECDRGGRATYHGPGQLVGYPVIDLRADRRNVRGYVRDLQEVLVRTLAAFGVAAVGGEERERIGVWVGHRKIASIGIHLRRWVTTHGFALNVCTDLDDFAGILSCGFDAGVMTSIEDLTGRRHDLAEVGARCAEVFAEVFERRLVTVEPGSLHAQPVGARIQGDTRSREGRPPES